MNKERRNALYKIVNALDEKSKELDKSVMKSRTVTTICLKDLWTLNVGMQ